MKDGGKPVVGFIGQGYIGKNYADDFEERGYTVVRYALEEPYAKNKDAIASCDIVFVAVPTPTKREVFDDSILRGVMPLIGNGKTAVIKSTMVPGTTEAIQRDFPDIFVMHSPEFLSRKTASEDARFPRRNIVGIPVDSPEHRAKAEEVLSILPNAPYTLLCRSKEAELIKYANNSFFYAKIMHMNLLYELAEAHGASWENIRNAMSNEPWIGETHIDPVHRTGRGAGGPCLIKDFATFRRHYAEFVDDESGAQLLALMEQKNLELLKRTGKDLDELESVYGAE